MFINFLNFFSFQVCKSCIVQYLEENTTCPICDTLLHQSHPLLYIALDKKLQAIVYKLVANLDRNELERQCKFYDERQLEYPAQLKEALETYQNNQQDVAALGSKTSSMSIKRENSDSTPTTSTQDTNTNKNGAEHNYHRNDEPIALCLEPAGDLKALSRKFMLCSCHATITHLKKYVALNVYSNIDQYKDLDILCQDEILGKDHTLKFVHVTKWKDKVSRTILLKRR